MPEGKATFSATDYTHWKLYFVFLFGFCRFKTMKKVFTVKYFDCGRKMSGKKVELGKEINWLWWAVEKI